jgi:UDPglucose 6-dehydrogenase
MRVSYFNEVDSYCLDNNFDTKNILDGICKDTRIGDSYNNPSFGYGGYCFPKDTKQALLTLNNVPQKLFKGIVDSNETRLKFLAENIIAKKKYPIGIYRLNMKSGSDNIRYSSTFMLMEKLLPEVDEILVYEPLCNQKNFKNKKIKMINSLSDFKDRSRLIIANRKSIELDDFNGEIFSRDVYNEN